MASVVRLLGERARVWMSIVRLLPLAGWPVVAWSVLVSLIMGLLPVGFIVGMSVMLERLEALGAGRHRAGAWATVLSAFTLAVGALVAQSVISPVQAAAGELLTRRIDGYCIRRLMTAALADAPMALLERRDVLDKLGHACQALTERWQTPGAAAAGLVALVARYTQFTGAVLLVGVVLGPLPAVVLAAVTVTVRVSSRGSLTRWSVVLKRSLGGPQRKLRYVLNTGSDTAVAKEVRVLGILPWLRARTEAEVWGYLAPLWKERRRIYFTPFLVFTAAVLAGAVAVLLQLRAEVAASTVSVLGLSLAIQAILMPLRMGTFFPEADIQTMCGMLALDTITELESLFRAETFGAETGPAARAWSGAGPGPGTAVRAELSRAAKGLPRQAIRFEDVRFAYPGGERNVLSGLDLELAAGSSTAIVGLNGAGKTTLVKLLAGLYEPTGGRITVDGTGLRDLDGRDWQRQIAVIFQDYVRYELDAATNIGLGAPSRLADEAALRAAADWAGASDIIGSLPAGFATPLSGRYAGGVDLSGGQWQRIALARALFAVGAGASVLVLDEPTAQLDIRAEVAFFDRFLEITSGLTSVVISHRFSTVRRADQIVVLTDGAIAEAGTHDELLARGGLYAELFHLQARRFTAGGRDATADPA